MARSMKDVQHLVAYPRGAEIPHYFTLLGERHEEFAPRASLIWTDVVERPDVVVLADSVRFTLPDRVEIWAWALCLRSAPGFTEARALDLVYVERIARAGTGGFMLPADFGLGAGALGLQLVNPDLLQSLLPKSLVEPPIFQFPDLSKI